MHVRHFWVADAVRGQENLAGGRIALYDKFRVDLNAESAVINCRQC